MENGALHVLRRYMMDGFVTVSVINHINVCELVTKNVSFCPPETCGMGDF